MSNKLTVLQVLPALDGGGVERGTLEIADALVKAGFRSFVMSAGGRLVRSLEEAGSQHIRLDVGKKSLLTFLLIPKIRKLLRDERINIVHVRSRMPAWILYFTLKTLPRDERPILVSTVHGIYSVNAYSAVMLKADHVIAVSKAIWQYVEQHYPTFDLSKMTLIPRGVDPKEFPRGEQPSQQWQQQFFQQYPILQNRFRICLPGRITRLKGHEEFIALMQALKRQHLPVVGMVVGGAEKKKAAYLSELKEKIVQAELTEDVVFVGHRSDMKNLYEISDLVLSLSSKPEAFGRTVLEALYLGVPVVGYDHGGVSEILHEIFPQGLVPFRDQEALIKKVMECIQNRPAVPVVRSFTLDKMKEDTLALYERVHQSKSS